MPAPLRVAVTGATGLLGSTLLAALRARGDLPVPLVRHPPRHGEVRWDPAGGWDGEPLNGIDAVVHLAGESIAGGRWSDARRERIERSRVDGTRALVAGLNALRIPPRVLISASAMGYYGDQGERPLDESAPSGSDWLASVARGWEEAAREAARAGSRVVHTRFGLLLSPEGGALARMLPPFRLGIGGRLGSGKQWMSWITLADTARVILAAIDDARYEGAINVATPAPVTNAEFTRLLGEALHRPTILPVPALALKLLFGRMAEETILASQRLVPARLRELGFEWRYPLLEPAFRHLLET